MYDQLMNQLTRPLLIFDGDCAFCTKSADIFKRLLGEQVQIEPWQFIPEQMAALGLTDEDGLTQVWFAEPSGKLTGGAEAVNRGLGQLWWFRPLSWLYYLPGIKQLQNRVYRWIAANRYRLPGGTPACALRSAEP